MGACLAQCGGNSDYRGKEGTATVGGNRRLVLLLCTHWQHRAFRVASSERVVCASAFRMGSNKSLFRKSCARESISFL